MNRDYDPVLSARIPKDLMEQVKKTGMSNREIITKSLRHYLENVVYKPNERCIQTNWEKVTQDIDNFLKRRQDGLNPVFKKIGEK